MTGRESAPGLVLGLLLLATACHESPAPGPAAPVPTRVTIGMHVVEVEVVTTPETRARGLGGRDRLAEGQGMLFPYAVAARHGFWMKDMRFDIDILWIRAGHIVDIAHSVPHRPPPSGELPIYKPRDPADLVLEVPAGSSERLGWQIGDRVAVEPPLDQRASAAD
jgi:hypothetical protein